MNQFTYALPNFAELGKKYSVVDMHFHTEYSHDCKTKLQDVLSHAKSLGIGVAVTDHNDIRGSLLALEQKDLFVIPGIEVTSKNDKDILLYFYSEGDLVNFYQKYVKKNLKYHKRFRFNKTSLSIQEIIDAAHDLNAVSSVAHPFTVQPKKVSTF